MSAFNRREWIYTVGSASLGALATANPMAQANSPASDSLPMQLYKSLSAEQRQQVCLPANHARRRYISNWWYIHPDYRIPSTFNTDQQAIIKRIFDSMHSDQHQAAVNEQVLLDQYGEVDNAPAAGFFGTPEDEDFEFVFTGHHVTRRCNAHTDKGVGPCSGKMMYKLPSPQLKNRTSSIDCTYHGSAANMTSVPTRSGTPGKSKGPIEGPDMVWYFRGYPHIHCYFHLNA